MATELPFAIAFESPAIVQPSQRGKNQAVWLRHLSLKDQAPFRRRMLGIFAVQLALVWALVAMWTYEPKARDPLTIFFHGHPKRVLIPLFAAIVLLLVLYLVRMRAPWNWLVLLLFSCAQSALFAGLGVTFDTNIGFFNCGATFGLVVVLILLTGMRARAEEELMDVHNPVIGAGIAYLIIAVSSMIIYGVYGQSLVTPNGFILSLGFQFLLALWLAFDTWYIYSVMSTADAMQGAINLYADMIAFVLALALFTISILSVFCGNDNVCCDGGDICGNGGFFGYYDSYGYYDCLTSDCSCNCRCCSCRRCCKGRCCHRKKAGLEAYHQPMQRSEEIHRV